MTRQPKNVVVYPFVLTESGPLFLLLRRSDNGVWQGVAGGLEESESAAEAAVRELREELCLSSSPAVIPLSMFSGVRRTEFRAHRIWPADVYIVEKFFFASDFSEHGTEVQMSSEHTDFEWLAFDLAHDRLVYTDERTALWELNERIHASDLPASAG
jgi:dATP pyrophosphohydrolase